MQAQHQEGIMPNKEAYTDPGEVLLNSSTCHFFRLPRELRDMVYAYATIGNTYIDRSFTNEKIRQVRHPASNADGLQSSSVPNTLCSGQAVNKLIFDESIPVLIRNTPFVFRTREFCEFVDKYSLVRKYITRARIHHYGDDEDAALHLSYSLNRCPKLTDLSFFIHWGDRPLAQQYGRVGRTRTAPLLAALSDIWSVAECWPPASGLYGVIGVQNFQLFVVDSKRPRHDELVRAKVEAILHYQMTISKTEEMHE